MCGNSLLCVCVYVSVRLCVFSESTLFSLPTFVFVFSGPGVCHFCVDECGEQTGEALQSRSRTQHAKWFGVALHGRFFSVGWRGALKIGRAFTIAIECPTTGCSNLWGVQPGCEERAVVGCCSVCWNAREEEVNSQRSDGSDSGSESEEIACEVPEDAQEALDEEPSSDLEDR